MPPTDITASLPEQGVPQPPPSPSRHRAREVTVVSIVTTVVLSIFATLLGPLGVLQSASAAAGTTPILRLDDGNATPDTYRAFLQQFRDNVGYHGWNQDGSWQVDSQVQGTDLTVEHTNPADPGYTEAVIVTADSHEVRLRFRMSDMYLVGWFDRDNRYNYLGPTDEAEVPAPVTPRPGETPPPAPRQLTDSASYVHLQTMGNVSRYTMTFGQAETENHAMSLWTADGSRASQTRAAAAAVYFAQFVSEAARFRDIGEVIEQQGFAETGYASTTIDSHLIDLETDWGRLSEHFAAAQGNPEGFDPSENLMSVYIRNSRGHIVLQTLRWAFQFAQVLSVANQYYTYSKPRRQLTGDRTFIVAPDGSGDYTSVQAAIDAVPADGVAHTIIVDPGTYHEVITVPKDRTHLRIKGATTNAADTVIYNTRAHGMRKPDGTPYGTEGSATATFQAADLTVEDLTISNTFDPKAHPEVGPYETQAVAVAAKGDRQVYRNVRILGRQDTLLVKGSTPTTQARQYFVNCYIVGTVDFIFGNATAVVDRSVILMRDWPGGTVLAPNTDYRKKYGILITDSWVQANGLARTKYLGRPWHNTPDAHPQAVVRDSVVGSAYNDTHPWTDMTPDYPWSSARFREYHNSGLGAGAGANAPKLTDAEAANYTAQKYLAGTDGWNPVR